MASNLDDGGKIIGASKVNWQLLNIYERNIFNITIARLLHKV